MPPRSRRALFALVTLVAATSTHAFVPRRLPATPLHHRLGSTSSPISAAEVESKLEGVWDKSVPPSIEAVIAQAQASLGAALESGEKRVRVDIRTPGLDEALEQTAIREKSLLLSVVGAFFPLLANMQKAKVLFESEGEAAMAAKAFSTGAWDIPEVRRSVCVVVRGGAVHRLVTRAWMGAVCRLAIIRAYPHTTHPHEMT